MRTLELVDPAIEVFKKQKANTFLQPPIEVAVLQRDNKAKIKERITPVFLNTNTGKSHSYSPFLRWFQSHLKKAGVRHRGPNHCRHSFASQLLTLGVSVEWIVYQLGHSSDKMVRKHYGRWIPEDAQNMARLVSKMIKNGPLVALDIKDGV